MAHPVKATAYKHAIATVTVTITTIRSSFVTHHFRYRYRRRGRNLRARRVHHQRDGITLQQDTPQGFPLLLLHVELLRIIQH